MAWEESKHPRDNSGQFTSKENKGQGGKEDKTEYKGAKIEKLTKLNGEEVYQFETEDGDVLTFKSLDEAKEYVDKNHDDFDNDYDFESWDNDISDEDVMQEIADGDYYYGGLGEQEIYNLAAERLNITPERAEQALKNQGFDYQEYQNYIEGGNEFDEEEFIETIDEIDYDKAEKNENPNYKNPKRKDKYGNELISDEGFKAGYNGAKAYLDYMTKFHDYDKLKKSNIFLSGLQAAANKAITESGYNPDFDITYQDLNEIIGSLLNEEVDYEKYEQNATSGFTGKKYSGYKPKTSQPKKSNYDDLPF